MQPPGQVPSPLNQPGAGQMVGAAGPVDMKAAELDEHVEPGQLDRVQRVPYVVVGAGIKPSWVSSSI